MKKNYIVIREFSFKKNSDFKVQSLPHLFTTEKRALEFVEEFKTKLVGANVINQKSMSDEFGNIWDKVILIETGSLTYYRVKIHGTIANI
jgi:hypothetical protein